MSPPGLVKNTDGSLQVPDHAVIPFIEGDGIGPDIWRAARLVMDSAVESAYAGKRKINWLEVMAGEKSFVFFVICRFFRFPMS